MHRPYGDRLVVRPFAYTQDLALVEDLVQQPFRPALARWSYLTWVRRVADHPGHLGHPDTGRARRPSSP
jgi:hypothetical protein